MVHKKRALPTIPQLPAKAKNRKGGVIFREKDTTTGRDGVVRLDKNGMYFWAEVGSGATYTSAQSTDGNEVRRWLIAQLARTTPTDRLKWQAVIEVNDTSNEEADRYGRDDPELAARCSLHAERYYLALTLDKKEWRRLSWADGSPDSPSALPDDEKFGASHKVHDGPNAEPRGFRRDDTPFRIPSFTNGGNRGTHETIIPYTVELWAGLQHVCETIDRTRADLKKILTTKAGVDALRAIGDGTGVLRLGSGAK